MDHVADANLFSWYSCGMWYLCRAKKLTSIYHHHLSILVPPSWAVGTTCFLSLTSINQHFTIQSFFTIIFQTIYHLFLSQPLPSTLLVTCYSSLMTYPYYANLPYFYGGDTTFRLPLNLVVKSLADPIGNNKLIPKIKVCELKVP